MIRSTEFLRRIIASAEDKEDIQCPTCARIATVSPWKTTSGGSLGEKGNKWWCAICGKNYDWKQSNMLLVVQIGESIDQVKVFKARAVSQDLRANLINALKLLTNQQVDVDGLVQNIVTSLGNGSRKDITHGLREFSKIDNERILEVGYLNRGMGTLKVRKPKVPEGCPEVTVR